MKHGADDIVVALVEVGSSRKELTQQVLPAASNGFDGWRPPIRPFLIDPTLGKTGKRAIIKGFFQSLQIAGLG